MAKITPFPLPDLAASLAALPGIGPMTAKRLAARDLRTWGDGIFFLPRRYEDRRRPTPISELEADRLAVVQGEIVFSGGWGRKGKVHRMLVQDQGGQIGCLWFRFKKAHLESYEKGQEVILVGQVSLGRDNALQMIHPELYRAAEAGPDHPSLNRLVPMYPELEGVRPATLRRAMAALVDKSADKIPDPLYGALSADLYPMSAGQALKLAHQPPNDVDESELDPDAAAWRRALAVNELTHFELGLALMRAERQKWAGRPLDPPGRLLERLLNGLPFRLTQGQDEALKAIRQDLAGPAPMGRLLCGDVATGKTVVAAAAAALAVEAGTQVAMMAPTEVLARQHLKTLSALLEPLGVNTALAVGAMNHGKHKRAEMAAGGRAQVLVGTHALFSKSLEFQDLGLVIIDEQHRFGVQQRLALAAKGYKPHMLVLSATPIPRTLALALAGHLEISDLPQRPLGQPKVSTRTLAFDERRRAVDALAQILARGERAYVICPLVEASESIEAQDAVQTHRRLSQYFPDAPIGLLHGRMDSLEQQEAIENFKTGRTKVLVATTVVEVGVDVPEATLMIVLGAERFGLSQLHQLRGRVGRGKRPGACLLVAGPNISELGQQRLDVLAASTDGLEIAEADLMLRGPGEALGARQTGLPPFKVARWERDAELIPAIRAQIVQWLREDPRLTGEALSAIKEETLRRWGARLGLTKAG